MANALTKMARLFLDGIPPSDMQQRSLELTASFSDYFMPRAGMIHAMGVYDHPVPTPTNALGAKGVGEAGCSGSLPALANATVDALRPLGIDHIDMPFSPARVWTAIQARKTV